MEVEKIAPYKRAFNCIYMHLLLLYKQVVFHVHVSQSVIRNGARPVPVLSNPTKSNRWDIKPFKPFQSPWAS